MRSLRRLVHRPVRASDLMQPPRMRVLGTWTVTRCLEHLQAATPDPAAAPLVTVVDANRRLVGLLWIDDLVRARPDLVLRDLAEEPAFEATADTALEDLALAIGRYHLAAIPVVTERHHPLGVVLAPDVIRALS